jgi:hypothetical protein
VTAPPLFHRRALIWAVAVASLSLVGGALLALLGSGSGRPQGEANADVYSAGATGHRALSELLRRLGRQVFVDEGSFHFRVETPAIQVVAEPDLNEPATARLRLMLAVSSRALLVLPKWSGKADPKKREFLASAEELPPESVAQVLELAGITGKLVRLAGPPARWSSVLEASPSLEGPQLLVTSDLTPLISTGGQILLGEREHLGKRLLILTDPDLIENHGLIKGDNARLAAALFARLGDGAVVFDETVHGHVRNPSIFRALLEPPLLFATLQALFAAVLLVWAALGQQAPVRRPDPPLREGKRALIDSTAGLLRLGGHTAQALDRYLQTTLQDDRIARSRTLKVRAEALAKEAALAQGQSPRQQLRVAQNIYAFRQRMLHGSE